MTVPFSPPDITELEIDEVVDTLKSGWITTGPKTKRLEDEIAAFCGTHRAVCLNSATAAMECALRLLGVGQGDEVITSAYTYTASASVALHVGAKVVLVDTAPNSYEMDLGALEAAITERTKVIIPVDVAGIMCNYEDILQIAQRKRHLFKPNGEIQEAIGRIVILADAAHSFGAQCNGKRSGQAADFTSFSFHAVKNFTTAEGGALTWMPIPNVSDENIYQQLMLLSLHGQSKDALAKTKLGAWEYDIVMPGYKCNMTDIMAALGLAQLKRYPGLLQRRREIVARYDHAFSGKGIQILSHYGEHHASSGHLYLTRLEGRDEHFRNQAIEQMAERGIACNVHYKPLPLLSAYRNLGFDMKDYPNAYAQYQNELTLPLHTLLSDEQVQYVIDAFLQVVRG